MNVVGISVYIEVNKLCVEIVMFFHKTFSGSATIVQCIETFNMRLINAI